MRRKEEHWDFPVLCLRTLGGAGALAPLAVMWSLGTLSLGVMNISNGFTVVPVGIVTVPALPSGPLELRLFSLKLKVQRRSSRLFFVKGWPVTGV